MHRLPRPRAVIFDWDNTLVDTWPGLHQAINATLVEMGHPPWTIEETRERIRASLRDSFPALFGERWTQARDVFYHHIRLHHLTTLKAIEGAASCVKAFHDVAVPQSVVSNKNGDLLRDEVSHLAWTKYFHRIIGAQDALRDKPDPAVVYLALAGLQIHLGDPIWFIGDTAMDMQCAIQSNCIPILYGEGTPGEDFAGREPVASFASFDALLTLITEL